MAGVRRTMGRMRAGCGTTLRIVGVGRLVPGVGASPFTRACGRVTCVARRRLPLPGCMLRMTGMSIRSRPGAGGGRVPRVAGVSCRSGSRRGYMTGVARCRRCAVPRVDVVRRVAGVVHR
jgi:hypothetical protein